MSLSALYQFPEGQIIAFVLVFLRIMAFVVAWPVFGAATVPAHLKVLLALLIAALLYPVVPLKNVDMIHISDLI